MPTALTSSQSRFLLRHAHDLKALLQIGAKGLTPAFLAELDVVLSSTNWSRSRLGADYREARDAMIAEIVEKSDTALVQRIGHVAVLYRPSKDHRQIVLPRK